MNEVEAVVNMTPFLWIATTFVSALVSGIVAVIISIRYYQKNNLQQAKLNTLRDFVAYRHDLAGSGFLETVNQVFVIYNDSEKVMEAVKRFHEQCVSGGHPHLKNQYLVELFKAMCDDVGIDYSEFTDSFFLTPFSPSGPQS